MESICNNCYFNNFSMVSDICTKCHINNNGEPSNYKRRFKDCCNCAFKLTEDDYHCDECREEVKRDNLFPSWEPDENHTDEGCKLFIS